MGNGSLYRFGRLNRHERRSASSSPAATRAGWLPVLQSALSYFAGMLTSDDVSTRLSEELARITDSSLLARICELLVSPYPVQRDWEYGRCGEQFVCWTVLEHPPSNTAVAYCEQGFGPSDPWGLVFLSGDHMGIGMDSGWFPTFESAMRESMVMGWP